MKQRRTREKFASPEEEIAYLREHIAQKEHALPPLSSVGEKNAQAHEAVREYAKTDANAVITPERIIPEQEKNAIVLNLPPDDDDAAIAELLGVVQEKGVRNALAVAEHTHNPHLEDDFHKVLIQYIKEGNPASGIKEKSPLWNELHMVLFEINVADTGGAHDAPAQKPLKELISSMEQFYAGLSGAVGAQASDQRHFSIELAVSEDRPELVFYVAIPRDSIGILTSQLSAAFPKARMTECARDYNIFVKGGATALAHARLSKSEVLPIKTYEVFDTDPIHSLIGAFGKIAAKGEGAALQIVVNPISDEWAKHGKKIIEKLEKGEKLSQALADTPHTTGGHINKLFRDLLFSSSEKKEKEDAAAGKKSPTIDQASIDTIRKKIETPIPLVNVCIATSALTSERAEQILADIESTFHQFENPVGNGFSFARVPEKRVVAEAKRFSFREFSNDTALPLSVREAVSLMHFPVGATLSAPHLKAAKSAYAPAPIGLPEQGTFLGTNEYHDQKTSIYLTPEDRLRHLYVIGQTGTGKTTLLKNMIVQDIATGNGVCIIDPHGSHVLDVLAHVPPERADDVIYFDPSHLDDVIGLNMLEYDPARPEQKTFVVNELLSIFKKLYGHVPESMGPAFEQYFRNATMLVLEDPDSGSTLLDVSRVLADSVYREQKLAASKNPVVNQFWREIASKAQGEASLQNIVPYITNKFDVFTGNDYMRPIIAQQHSAFNFRDIMDTKKILLVNLSKGRLGDINANLIGLIIVGKILMAALSRADAHGTDLPAFYLYIDEFQNITTDSISTILSEARKYKLSLTLAHQFITQIEKPIQDAVFGNVGSIAAFRVGADDAKALEPQFVPVVAPSDLMNIENFNCYVRLLAHGIPQKPFSIRIAKPEKGDPSRTAAMQELSYKKYGKKREEVENEIKQRYGIGV